MQLGMAMQQNDSILSVQNLKEACEVFRKAISIHQALAAADPADGEYQHALGADYGSLGYTQRKISDLTGDPENYHLSVQSHLKELQINEALFKSDLTNPSYLNLFGVAHMDVANSQIRLGDASHALEHFRKYLTSLESLERRLTRPMSNSEREYLLRMAWWAKLWHRQATFPELCRTASRGWRAYSGMSPPTQRTPRCAPP